TFAANSVDAVRVSMLMEMVKREGVQVDEADVSFAAGNALTRMMLRLQQDPLNMELLQRTELLAAILEMLPFRMDYWKAQNIYYALLQAELPGINRKEDPPSRAWAGKFLALGEKLQVAVPALAPPRLQAAS
ncbi:MAG: hypothetical protein ACRD4F_06965, partial [Candidatus Angelobacter sp.]